VRVLAAISVALAAVLTFTAQPMAARLLLPSVGGSPAVWGACVVFFQAALLAGYAYAHGLARLGSRVGPWPPAALHAGVLLAAGLALPAAPVVGAGPGAGASAGVMGVAGGMGVAGWVFAVLAMGMGLPMLAVAATAPLAQHWLSGALGNRDHRVYRLYAWSNAGSLGGLAAYPLVIEPRIGLSAQAWWWSAGAVVLGGCVLLLGALAAWQSVSPRDGAESDRPADGLAGAKGLTTSQGPTWRRRAWWVLLAAVPSSLLLGVTTHITTDLAPVPLLWVGPLGLYLLTYILAFSGWGSRAGRLGERLMPVGLALVLLLGLLEAREPIGAVVVVHLIALLGVGLALHGKLAQLAPPPAQATGFYLWLALGGVVGGAFNTLAAPVLFNSIAEYPLALILAAVLLSRSGPSDASNDNSTRAAPGPRAWLAAWWPALALLPAAVVALGHVLGLRASAPGTGGATAVLLAGVPAVLVYALAQRPAAMAAAFALAWAAGGLALRQGEVERERTFFGVHRVVQDQRRTVLFHGTTIHGSQDRDRSAPPVPLTYYYPTGPIGRVFAVRQAGGAGVGQAGPMRVALIGLGAGSLAAYARAGDAFSAFEIDPAVVRFARDERYFAFLARAASPVEVLVGDGRLLLRERQAGAFDLIVVDAFSSDAIPVHLLTREALDEATQRLAPGGWLALHISNRHLDLAPVVARLAGSLGLAVRIAEDDAVSPAEAAAGKEPSVWAVLARSEGELAALAGERMFRTPPDPSRADPAGRLLWTDDRAHVLSAWRR
jgi:SAM-dependent methyltransferase